MRRKTKKFQLRMRPEDYQALMRLANEDGLTMSEWITDKIREANKRRKGK